MEKRILGKTGEALSIIGFGGIVVTDTTPKEADRFVGEGIDKGINYFDVAPQYGNAQERLGPALKPYRDDVFLACKTLERDAGGARADLENSLKLLKTDQFFLLERRRLRPRTARQGGGTADWNSCAESTVQAITRQKRTPAVGQELVCPDRHARRGDSRPRLHSIETRHRRRCAGTY